MPWFVDVESSGWWKRRRKGGVEILKWLPIIEHSRHGIGDVQRSHANECTTSDARQELHGGVAVQSHARGECEATTTN